MYSIMAAGFLVMTIGMTVLLLVLGWQQRKIDRAEIEAERKARADRNRKAAAEPPLVLPAAAT